jgi:hypothetical protein
LRANGGRMAARESRQSHSGLTSRSATRKESSGLSRRGVCEKAPLQNRFSERSVFRRPSVEFQRQNWPWTSGHRKESGERWLEGKVESRLRQQILLQTREGGTEDFATFNVGRFFLPRWGMAVGGAVTRRRRNHPRGRFEGGERAVIGNRQPGQCGQKHNRSAQYCFGGRGLQFPISHPNRGAVQSLIEWTLRCPPQFMKMGGRLPGHDFPRGRPRPLNLAVKHPFSYPERSKCARWNFFAQSLE